MLLKTQYLISITFLNLLIFWLDAPHLTYKHSEQVLQSWTKVNGTTTKNGIVLVATIIIIITLFEFGKNVWFWFRSCFSALWPEIKHFRIHKNSYFPVKFVVSSIIFVQDCRAILHTVSLVANTTLNTYGNKLALRHNFNTDSLVNFAFLLLLSIKKNVKGTQQNIKPDFWLPKRGIELGTRWLVNL